MPNSNTAKNARRILSNRQEASDGNYNAEINKAQGDRVKDLKVQNKSCANECKHLDMDYMRCKKGRRIVTIHSICFRYEDKS